MAEIVWTVVGTPLALIGLAAGKGWLAGRDVDAIRSSSSTNVVPLEARSSSTRARLT